MTPEPLGAIIGIFCIILMVYLFKHCEVLENGNIDRSKDD